MKFNDNWYYQIVGSDVLRSINLPHDAMRYEKRTEINPSGKNGAYFQGNNYIYNKSFSIDKKYKTVFFRFEGIYHNSKIYINDKLAYERHNGFVDFIFDATQFITFGLVNEIRIEVENKDQPNCRWYSGAGIYRSAHIYMYEDNYFIPRTTKIKTLDYYLGKILLSTKTKDKTNIDLKITDGSNKVVLSKTYIDTNYIEDEIEIPNCINWSVDNPYLYHAVLSIDKDVKEEITFGVREISISKEEGLLINNKRVVLLGACIHSDNGLIGAEGYEYSDKRKARLIKANGFNSIRSAHNPISSAFLEEADRIGLLVLDEYADSWYIHKTKYDYASYLENEFGRDLSDMVDKDYSHPSVIMYSIGNEVGETAFERGIELTDKMTKCLHLLDSSRPVTCGINVFFNALAHTPFAQYSDKKSNVVEKKETNSSEFFNNLAGIFGANFMKTGATIRMVDKYTKGAFSKLDIAGYNYGIKRYEKDLIKYPNRIILGTETFCNDAVEFMSLANKHKRIIGDFVWAGMDYLGEVSVGAMLSKNAIDYTKDKSGWISASSGMLDLLGDSLSQNDYEKVAFRHSVIKVGTISPKELNAPHSPSAWRFSRAIPSWAYSSYINEKVGIEIYSLEPYYEIYIDGKLIKKGKMSKKGVKRFTTKYNGSELKAVALSKDKKIVGECILKADNDSKILNAIPEQEKISIDDLVYLNLYVNDNNGVLKTQQDINIKIESIENGSLLGFGSAIPYCKEGHLSNSTKTYYGRAQAVIKPESKGKVLIRYSSILGKHTITIIVE